MEEGTAAPSLRFAFRKMLLVRSLHEERRTKLRRTVTAVPRYARWRVSERN